jgi:hypothetical protein
VYEFCHDLQNQIHSTLTFWFHLSNSFYTSAKQHCNIVLMMIILDKIQFQFTQNTNLLLTNIEKQQNCEKHNSIEYHQILKNNEIKTKTNL